MHRHPMFGPSAPLIEPTMASADFWVSISLPRDKNSPSADIQTSPGNAPYLHTYTCHIYTKRFRVSIGL